MATSVLLTNCNLSLLMPEIIDQCHPFTCGTDDDMDEFFRKDALDYTHFLMGKSCCFRLKNDPEVLRFYEKNNFKPLFPREIDEDIYTKPPKDNAERTERMQHPCRLRTRLMFCDLLEE